MIRRLFPYGIGLSIYLSMVVIMIRFWAAALDISEWTDYQIFLYLFSPLAVIIWGGIAGTMTATILIFTKISKDMIRRVLVGVAGITLVLLGGRELYRHVSYTSFFGNDKKWLTSRPYSWMGDLSPSLVETGAFYRVGSRLLPADPGMQSGFPARKFYYFSPNKQYEIEEDFPSSTTYIRNRRTGRRIFQFEEPIFDKWSTQWTPDSKYFFFQEGWGGSSSPPLKIYCIKTATGEKLLVGGL